MEGRRNEMYSRAAKTREGGWTQGDMAVPQRDMHANAGQIPEIIEPPVTMQIPLPVGAEPVGAMRGSLPEIVEPPAATPTTEACGFCITPAMAYVPAQKWGHTYEAEMGFARGTIFPELDLPFLGGACNNE